MQDPQDRALAYVRAYGPVLPVQLAKGLKIDLTLAGALLSELYANKQVFMSTAKIGTSKVYYTPGQETKLQILYDHLGATPKKAYDILKTDLVVKDSACTPWQRVAYREMVDFAKSVTYNNETYWRWYLVSEQDALEKLKPVEVPKIELKEEPPIKIIPEVQTKVEVKEEIKELVKEEKTEVKIKPKSQKKQPKQKEQQAVLSTPTNHQAKRELPNELTKFFTKHGITSHDPIYNYENKEIHMKVIVPAALGTVPYFAIYLDKKKLNENDVGMAYAKGQQYKSPILLLSSGELSKKAEKFLEEEYHGGVIFREV